MIANEIIERAQSFQTTVNQLFDGYPRYQLDLSWPSIGVIDRILSPFRGRATLSESEREVVCGAACYLALMTHDSWDSFFDKPEVMATITQVPSVEVIVAARGGAFLPRGATFKVKLVQSLLDLLASTEPLFAHFERSQHPRLPGDNIVSPFAAGLFSGLTPFGEGEWARVPAGEFRNLIAADDILSRSSADHYGRITPSESHGASADLYRHQLILPPAYFAEHIPYERAVSYFVKFVKDTPVEGTELIKLCTNLMMSTDHAISIVGFAALTSLTTDTPSPRLLAAAHSFRPHIQQLKPAILLARSLLSETRTPDWLVAVSRDQLDEAKRLIRIDQALELNPLLLYDPSFLEDPNLFPLLHHLSWGEGTKARQFLDLYSEKFPLSIALVLQSIHLALQLKDRARARNELSALDPQTLKEGSIARARLLLFRARLHPELALDALTSVVNETDPFSEEYSRAALRLAEAHLVAGRFALAEPLLESLRADSSNREYVPALLSTIRLRALEGADNEAIAEILKELVSVAPQHPSTFEVVRELRLISLQESDATKEAAPARR